MTSDVFEVQSKIKTVVELDYGEFDAMVAAAWPDAKEYSFVASEESANDTSRTYDVDPGDFDPEEIAEFAAGNSHGMYMAGSLLGALCAIGAIPKGQYLINVCW